MKWLSSLVLVSLAFLPFAGPAAIPASADEDPFESGDAGDVDDAAEESATDDSTPEYLKALEYQRGGKWTKSKKMFEKLLEEYPDSIHYQDADERGGENCYLGCEILHESGPPSRRVDVAVMGDGFTIKGKSQKKQGQWAELCVEVLFSEYAFNEYRKYFNYYFVRLCSFEEGVDEADPDAAARKAENEERRKKRKKKKRRKKNRGPKTFSTALECRQAGPQGQVMADRELVFKWLNVAAKDVPGVADDALVIAFAQFGKLGMGGGGVANVGRPDKSVTVHEFGHAYVGLLDEYANNPMKPRFAVRAPNATSDEDDVPWQHWLDKKTKGVGVYEGGATYKQGVWRPARSCAMNSAGNTNFCPPCREAAILRIYAVVRPIDTFSPATSTEMHIVEGDDRQITVTPMQPASHELTVSWLVEDVSENLIGPDEEEEDDGTSGFTFAGGWGSGGAKWFNGGDRLREDRDAFDDPVEGKDLSRLAKKSKKSKKRPRRHMFPLGKLDPGRYKITVEVKDETKYVIKDERHLLEDRETWWVTVKPKP